jgi:hypothetical protein
MENNAILKSAEPGAAEKADDQLVPQEYEAGDKIQYCDASGTWRSRPVSSLWSMSKETVCLTRIGIGFISVCRRSSAPPVWYRGAR